MNPGTEGKFFIFHCASSVREAKNLCIVAHTRVAHNVWGTPASPGSLAYSLIAVTFLPRGALPYMG